SDTVSVLLGNGDGAFQDPRSFPAGDNPYAVAVGEFNGDGIADLAVANAIFGVSVLLGDGDGTFQDGRSFTMGGSPRSVAGAAFNGDAVADLATGNWQGNAAGGLLGNRDGTLPTAPRL